MMASLDREVLEKEIAACKAALKAHQHGIVINEIVLKAFKEELEKYPKKKKTNAMVG